MNHQVIHGEQLSVELKPSKYTRIEIAGQARSTSGGAAKVICMMHALLKIRHRQNGFVGRPIGCCVRLYDRTFSQQSLKPDLPLQCTILVAQLEISSLLQAIALLFVNR